MRRTAGLPLLLALLLPLSACLDDQTEARTQLRALHTAMTQHDIAHGGYPRTVDPSQPASETNLAWAPAKGVEVRILDVSWSAYRAEATSGSWTCSADVRPQVTSITYPCRENA